MLKSLIALLMVILQELGDRCGTSTTRDLKTITSRIEHEGISFLTISLASFGSDFQKSLDQGFVGSDQFVGFQRTGGLPRFLSGFLCRVFDSQHGRLLEDPCIDAIHAIRQITLMFAKMHIECSPERDRAAYARYIQCEKDVRLADQRLSVGSSEAYRLEDFRRVSGLLWAELFSSIDSRIYNEAVRPKHGPGATADKLRGNAKYNQLVWTRRLEEVFPHWENLIPSESFLERMDSVTILEPGAEIPVKVISVPKTLKTPRLIAKEPTCMQYMQQGVLSVMMEEIEGSDNARNFVMFKSQEPNQRLAREGSITGTLATLDLSEASDRVSNQHVRNLLSRHSILRDAVEATRSRKADVNGYGVQRLAKFASMGSALCFPIESLVFATVIFVGIQRQLNRPLTQKDVKSFYGRVRVYGDDIIVPVDFVQIVVEELEAFGFRVNSDKSFWTGKFRESCGADFYDGWPVNVIRLRSFLPDSKQHVPEIVSTVSTRNQFYLAGMWRTAAFLDDWLRKIIPLPDIQETSSLLGRLSFLSNSQGERWDDALHVPLVRGMKVVAKSPASPLDDYGALMKWFLKEGDEPFLDQDHLERAGRPASVRIKSRWAPPF